MRRFACTLLLLPFVGLAHADEPRVLIERALKAMGGVQAVKQQHAVRMRVKGQFLFGKAEGEYFRWDEKYKLIMDVKDAGSGIRITIMSNGEKSWVEANGQVLVQSAKDDGEQAMLRHVDRVTSLTDLLTDKGFTFAALPDATVESRPARVVKVSYKGQPDTNLFFDKEAGLLVKYAYRSKYPLQAKENVLHETILSDYREPDLAAADEKLLREAKIDVTGPGLLALLLAKTVSPERMANAHALIKQLGDDAFRVRQRASKELVALGSMAIPLLREAAKDTDREVARRGRDCLQRIGAESNQTLIAAAVRLLALRKPDGVVKVLLDYLPNADTDAAKEIRAVLFALAQKDGKPDPVLVRALDDKELVRRQAAAAALGKDGGAYARQPGRRLFGPMHKTAMKIDRRVDGEKNHEVLEMYDFQFFNAFEDKMFTRP